MLDIRHGLGTQHVLTNSRGRISAKFEVDGTLTDATGDVTISVVDENGTTLVDSQTASNDSTGIYYYDLGTSNTSRVRRLTVTWSGTWESVAQSKALIYEVVGNFLFTEVQARQFDDSALNSASVYTDELIADERVRITDLLFDWTSLSWIPRFHKAKLQGEYSPELLLPHRLVNSLISVTIDGTSIATNKFELDTEVGVLYYKDGYFTQPTQSYPINIVVEYEHGYQGLVDGVDRIALKMLRLRLPSSNIPENTRSFTDSLGTADFIVEGTGPFGIFNRTRSPEVNAWLEQHSSSIIGW